MSLILISDILLVIFALICLVIASITDIKKREVANWLCYSLLAVALSSRAIAALFENNLGYFLYALIAGIIVFILVTILYYSKVLGGGDAKLLIALACCFATSVSLIKFDYGFYFAGLNVVGFSLTKNFLFDFFVNCLIVGFFYSLVFSIIMAFRNRKTFKKKFNELNKKILVFKILFIVIAIVFFVFSLLQKSFPLIILAIFFFILPYLYVFVKSTEASSLIKMKSWKELSEGDWLIKEIKIGKKILKPSADGLSKQDIALIKRANKKVLIKDGIPFVPVFLLSVLASLLAGNLLFRILQMLV